MLTRDMKRLTKMAEVRACAFDSAAGKKRLRHERTSPMVDQVRTSAQPFSDAIH
jgi:hypothetical protein